MNCLINGKGELLEIIQDEKEIFEKQYVVPLDGYYEVFNDQRYEQATWHFESKSWKGTGSQNAIVVSPIPQQDLQKAKLEIATLNLLTDLGVI